MSLIDWKDEYALGIPSVDHEHRELIEEINRLHDAVAGGDATEARVLAALGDIYAGIAAHFALEERIMRGRAYPSLDEHKADHEKLLDDLRDIMESAEDEGRYDDLRLAQDLEEWFGVHFRTHDARLHRWL